MPEGGCARSGFPLRVRWGVVVGRRRMGVRREGLRVGGRERRSLCVRRSADYHLLMRGLSQERGEGSMAPK